jgi:ribose transport system substrate-binding protein
MEATRRVFALGAISTLLALSGCDNWTRTQQDSVASTAPVGLVVTSIDNPYFVEMVSGARAGAAAEPKLNLTVQAPERGAVDPERQQQLIEALIARRSGVLLVVPADSKQIIGSIQSANRANIPFIVLDNDVDQELARKRGVRIAAFIGSDNIAGGRLAGDFVKKRLPDGGEVAILEGVAGVQAAIDRKSGFTQSVGQQPSLKIVASQVADWDREKAYNATRALLVAHPKLKAIFAANDEMGLGAAKALAEARRRDIVLVGYDATPDGRAAVTSGRMAATIAQQPGEVGRLGVDFARRILAGEKVPPRTSVPLQVVATKP